MNKKILCLVIVVILAVTVMFVFLQHKEANSEKDTIYKIVENNYADLKKVTDNLSKYNTGDRLFLADADDAATFDLVKGHLYVEHDTDNASDTYEMDAVNDEAIDSVFGLGQISEIKKTKNAIVFECNNLMSADKNNYSFCGFYCSSTSKPQIVAYFEGGSLKEAGKGWTMDLKDKYQKYDTEKIKGDFYYYEGTYCP